MSGFLVVFAIFVTGYMINVFYITVLYHRGLTHQSVILSPLVTKWVGLTGVWVTGLDPKAWVCMHRMHHMFSDTEKDPHSPQVHGVLGVAKGQLLAYNKTLRGLIGRRKEYSKIVADIPFEISFLNRKGLWLVPYITHLSIGLILGFVFNPWIGVAYFLGIMSHPIQGWMVNALAHKYGYRNFSIEDHSTNNWLVSFLVFGEGYQNNHHARPKRANFAIKSSEIDFGYTMCQMAKILGMLKFPKAQALADESH